MTLSEPSAVTFHKLVLSCVNENDEKKKVRDKTDKTL
jgi:hypothetical protein